MSAVIMNKLMVQSYSHCFSRDDTFVAMKNVPAALIFCFVAIVQGCVKPPEYSDVPSIEFKSVSRGNILSGDTVILTLKFEDGNGDIGPIAGTPSGDTILFYCRQPFDSTHAYFNNAAFNVMFMDRRDSCWNRYATAYIEPKGKYDDLSGELDVIVGGFCKKVCSGCADTVIYDLVLRDRAGNFSNRVTSLPVVITCP